MSLSTSHKEPEKDHVCWCGAPRGPRDPSDADGWGCLGDIQHVVLPPGEHT